MAMLRNLWRNKAFLFMALPGTIWLILFFYIPVFGNIVAFKNFHYSSGGFFKVYEKVLGLDWITLNFYFHPIMLI